jgi:transcriptional regulator with XRE-family HTH domain
MGALAEYLKARRAALGLTQTSLARRLGVAPGHLARIENGERRPSLKLLARIAETLSVESQSFESHELLIAAYPETKQFLVPTYRKRAHGRGGRS